jgi:dTDP-glucose 4,6-dehydratase
VAPERRCRQLNTTIMTSAHPAVSPLANDLQHIMAHTSAVWEQVRGANIFVTGGTGFFGRWLLESFAHANQALALNARLFVLSRNPDAFTANAPHLASAQRIHFVRGDVRTFDAGTVRAQLGAAAPERFTFVIHAATDTTGNMAGTKPLQMVDTVVQGTRAALEFAIDTGASRFLLTSSGAVYGRQPPEMTHVPETFMGAPDCAAAGSAYSEGKRVAELLCACYHQEHALEATIARCFAFVGPFLPLDAHFAIGNFMRDALAGEPIVINGDGTPYRSYLHAADLTIWLWTILLRGAPARAYNVGSEDGRPLRDIADAVAAARPGTEVIVKTPADPAKPAQRYVPSCERAREELGLKTWIDLEDAIRRTLDSLERTKQAER